MRRPPPHFCSDKQGCAVCERAAEDRAEQQHDGDVVTERDYDELEAGAWWNYPPGMEPRRGW